MTLIPKQQNVRDKKFRASFGVYREHRCLITGAEFTEGSSESVDGAHVSIGNYARGMKASDDLILPLVHRLHMEFDQDQVAFSFKYRSSFMFWGESLGIYWIDIIGDDVTFVKACARAYYEKWKEGNG